MLHVVLLHTVVLHAVLLLHAILMLHIVLLLHGILRVCRRMESECEHHGGECQH